MLLQKRPCLGMNRQRPARALLPDAVLEPGALRRGEIHRYTTQMDKLFEEARIQRLNCIRPAPQEQMNMMTLRNSFSRLWLGRKSFAFQDCHPLEAIRQGACRQETGHAGADYYSLSAGSSGGHGKDGSFRRGLNQASCRSGRRLCLRTAWSGVLPEEFERSGCFGCCSRPIVLENAVTVAATLNPT